MEIELLICYSDKTWSTTVIKAKNEKEAIKKFEEENKKSNKIVYVGVYSILN